MYLTIRRFLIAVLLGLCLTACEPSNEPAHPVVEFPPLTLPTTTVVADSTTTTPAKLTAIIMRGCTAVRVQVENSGDASATVNISSKLNNVTVAHDEEVRGHNAYAVNVEKPTSVTVTWNGTVLANATFPANRPECQ